MKKIKLTLALLIGLLSIYMYIVFKGIDFIPVIQEKDYGRNIKLRADREILISLLSDVEDNNEWKNVSGCANLKLLETNTSSSDIHTRYFQQEFKVYKINNGDCTLRFEYKRLNDLDSSNDKNYFEINIIDK